MENISELIKSKNYHSLREYVNSTPITDIAKAIEELNSYERVLFFRILKTEDAAEIFSYLSYDTRKVLVENFTDDLNESIINELKSNEIADLLEEAPSNLINKVLSSIDNSEKRRKVNQILKYDENQVGSIMSVDMSVLWEEMTMREALDKIKKDRKAKAQLEHYFFVVDKKRKLLGSVALEDIIFEDPYEKIKNVMFSVNSILTTDTLEHAALIFSKEGMSVLPVINQNKYLIGMVTTDEIIEVIQEEATEDMYKMAGIVVEDSSIPYHKMSIKSIVKSRIVWLIFLMLGSTLSQIVIQLFTNYSEKSIEQWVAISVFVAIVPVISGAAGNAGSQSSTTITRSLALNEFEKKKFSKIFWREIWIGFIIGAILFIMNFLRLIIYFSISGELRNSQQTNYWVLIFTSSFALMLVIIFAKALGSLVPLLALKLKKDPAVMSAPILATVSDAFSTVIFFSITIGLFLTFPWLWVPISNSDTLNTAFVLF